MTTSTPQPLTISISEQAAGHVQEFAEQMGKPDGNLRVGVKGGGCSGLTYVLDLVEEPKEGDKVIEGHGVKLYVDRKSYIFLAGTTLEYSGGLNGKGFVFNNPNAKTTCGCGTSFSV
jgi:iron-sulfur cluster assembly protein